MSGALLELRSISRTFGGIHAVEDVSLTLRKGEIVGLIGPNGAGKTTLINCMTGAFPPSSGTVVFMGEEVTRQKPFEAARRGLCRTFQIVQPFPQMTVLENVAAGALFGAGVERIEDARQAACEHLAFVGIETLADMPASSLTLASRKRLELAKSLAMGPKMLMLDEVNAGLNSAEIDGAVTIIRRIAERGITILLVEHLMKVIMSLSERIFVLHHGRLIAEGAPDAIINDSKVIEAYLGEKFAQRLVEMGSA